MKTLIYGGTIINEGRRFKGAIVINNGCIAEITEGENTPRGDYDKEVDATGDFIMPGVIDDHVHFRQPGLTTKGDIASESRAAAYGGVTSFFEMPNTVPQTTTLETLAQKQNLGRENSCVNYSFFFGATSDNTHLFSQLDATSVPGIKLFMGSSTGNMLVDRREVLEKIFSQATLPVMTHCEDTSTINRNMAEAKGQYGDDPPVRLHPKIRSEEACLQSTKLAIELAQKHGTRLHVAHVTTAREISLFGTNPNITAEVVVPHLLFSEEDYEQLGTLIKCNPAVKTRADRDALRAALTNGRATLVGTDHAPHRIDDKQGGCAAAASGMPMVQFSLVSMLQLADQGVLSLERIVELMCHQPARLFGVSQRGFLRSGYKADIVILRRKAWTLTKQHIQSKCGWSPLQGKTFNWQVLRTFCNGHLLLDADGTFDEKYRGEQIRFENRTAKAKKVRE